MRVLKFTKIDAIKVWRFLYILLFPVIAVFANAREPDGSAVFGVIYCLFVGIVLAAMPFRLESPEESGFLQLLPAKPGEQVLGHFLFGLLNNLAGFALGLLCTFIAHAINPAARLFTLEGMPVTGLYPVLLGVALVFTGAEALLMTTFRFHNLHADQLLRILPAFVFLFGMNSLATNGDAPGRDALLFLSGAGGYAALGVCLAIFLALALLAAGISRKRGQS